MSRIGRRLRFSLVLTLIVVFAVSSFSVLRLVNTVQAAGLTLKWVRNVGLATYIAPLGAHLIPGTKEMQIVVDGVPTSEVDLGYTNGNVAVLNGSSGAVMWNKNVGNVGDHSPLEVADLANDGNLKVIVANVGDTLVLNGSDGSTYWKNNGAPSYFNYPVVGDVDGDGHLEVFVCSGNGPYLGTDNITELSWNGTILAQTPDWHPCWGGLGLGDPAFNGSFILLEGDRSSTYSDASDPFKGGGWGVRTLDARTLTPLWNDSSVLCSSYVPMFADVDGDGILDVVVQMQSKGLAVYNAFTGSVLTTGGIYRKNSTLPGISGSANMSEHSQPTIFIGANGDPEIIVSHDTNPIIWDLRTWTLTATLNVTCGDPPKVGHVTADGQMDIIAVDNSGTVHIFNAQTFQEVANYTGLSAASQFALVADVDGDGYNELVLSSRSGNVYCFKTPALASNPAPRSNVQFSSQYRLGVAEYVEPPGPKAPQIRTPSPANGMTGVSTSQSTLSFNLFDYQGNLMNYTVTTSPNVGGGTLIKNVSNGRYSVSIGGLSPSTKYLWTVSATDGSHPNSTTYTFTTQPNSTSGPPWWNYSWSYRKSVTIDHTKVVANLVNFPVLVDITDSGLAGHAQSNGNDIVFVDSNGNKLSHEIESYTSSTGHLTAWVKIPNLSSASDTVMYMYYGNPAASNQQNPTAVWDSNFLMIQHLEGASSTQYDSTANGNNGAITGSVSQVSGKIDGSLNFNGGYVSLPQVCTSQTTRFTFSAWIYPQSGARYFISEWVGNQGAFLQVSGDSQVQLYVDGVMVQKAVTLGQWQYVVGTYDGTTASLYVNGGSPSSVSAASPTWGSQSMFIGDRYDHARQFKGLIDEVRVSNIARSNSWIATEYANQNNPSTFLTVGIQQSYS